MLGISQLEAQLLETEDVLKKIDLLNEIVFQLRNLNPRRSHELMEQINKLLVQYPDYTDGRMMLSTNQGTYAFFQGDYELALSQLSEVVAWYRKHGGHANLARALNFLGLAYTFGGEPATGLETLLEAMSLVEQSDRQLEYAMILGDLGVAHTITEIPERWAKALAFTRQALALFTQLDDLYGIALASNNISAILIRMQDDTQALTFAETSLAAAQKIQNHYVALLLYPKLAKHYAQYGDLEKAREYLSQGKISLQQMKQMGGSGASIAQYYYRCAVIYHSWEELSIAQALLAEGIQVAHEGRVRHTEYQCHELLATIHEQQGNLAEALEHYKQFHLLKELVFNEENEDRLKSLSVNYDLKQTQLEADYQRSLQEEGQRYIQRLESVIDELEAFSYTISHDLHAPLRSIISFSEILLEDYRDQLDSEGQKYLNTVIHVGRHMENLINDLLRLSHITRSELQLTTVDLSQIVTDITIRMSEREPQREVEWKIMPGLKAEGDKGLLQVALENLLNNAWKYSRKRDVAHIEFGCEEKEEAYVYYVRDNGVGFDMAYVDKLFWVFERLHGADEFEGTGVGLATVQRIIARHGGQVWAEGAIDQGATFYFRIPAI